MHQVHTRAGFPDEPVNQIMELDDVDGGHDGTRSRPSSSGGRRQGVESTHSVFQSVQSQVHQLGVSLESVTSHIAALAQLASLAANSGSQSFGGGAQGSATPRLGASLRERPEAVDTRAGENSCPGC